MKKDLKFKKGDRVKVISNNTGSMTPVGTIVTIDSAQGNQIYYTMNGSSCSKNKSEFTLIEITVKDFELSLKNLDNDIKKIEEEKAIILDKINFMKENALTVLDEDQYKAFGVLKLLDNKALTTIEKSKLIADLIK
jgi:hypothetical protein